jgi:hypothetical protein
MLISTNTASIKPTEHKKNVDKTKDKALVYIKRIVIGIYTIKNIYIEKDTKKAKKIEDFNKRSAMFITNKAAG